MKILLVSPHDSTYKAGQSAFKRQVSYYALTLPTLAALVPEELGADVRLVDEGVQKLGDIGDADLVGISVITPSAPRAYELGDLARGMGIPVVMGGPHVTLMPDEAALHADCVVTGFADQTWPELLLDFARGEMKPRYSHVGRASVDGLPDARRDLLDLKKYLRIPCVQASRGCPNECTFCAIPAVWGRDFHQRPVKEVVREIESLDTKRVLFLDPAIAERPAYARELYRELAPLKIKWGGLSTVRITEDPELLQLAKKSGCVGLLIGFESIHQKSLDGINKGFADASGYLQAVRTLHDNGMGVLGTFVFGLEGDDDDVFKRTADFIDEARIDMVRYSVFTPFPGTKTFEQLDAQGRILTRDWGLYNTENVVFRPLNITPERLQEGLRDAWRQTVSYKSIFKRVRWLSPGRFFVLAVNLGFRFYAKRVLLG